MSNFKIKNPEEFTSELRKFETTDRNHADVFNAVAEILINNDAFLKKIADAADIHMKNNAAHVPSMEGVGTSKYLRGDGTWQTPPDTNTTYGVATQSASGLMSADDKKKLDGVAANANNFTYTHPTNHAASMITQDATHRFVSDTEKATWNGKAGTGTASQSANGLMSAADKKKLDGIASGANAYSHPSGSGNNHIPSGGSSGQILRWSAAGTAVWGNDNNTTYGNATQSVSGLMSATDKQKLDGIASGANNYSHPANHAASMITQDATHRFVSDTEKATWNATARIIYVGWGTSITIPYGKGIHGIVIDDWRYIYGVCVQGNTGSQNINIRELGKNGREDSLENIYNASFNNSTKTATITRRDGGTNSVIYIGL